MDFFNFITMLGGLALFLYGMNALGDGLTRVSGGKLEKILEKLTSNRIKAVLLGAGVTGVIQSSSATTVMVVGFVNSGIMKLSQTVGIIMGANIGTTVTSWILSLSGIESSNFFVKLLKPSSFSPILAVIGVILIMFSKKDKKKDIGTIFIGFAILMFGMDTMSNAVKPLADVPEFTRILTMFSNPVMGMMAGLILTAIIQSSSASVGILQALCATGSVSFGTAIPIIMGQNIGTCVTAILSSIGANRNAKRAALIHLYFNLIGTIVFMVIFYSLNAFLDFTFLNDSANAAGIAIVHTGFNVFATILLFPFAKKLEKLAYLSVRDEKMDPNANQDSEFQLLDVRFLETPAFAVDQCKNVAIRMAELAKDALLQSMDLIKNFDEKKATQVLSIEAKIDKYEDVLGSYLVKLSSKSLTEKDSGTLTMLLHCIGDFERISDHATNLVAAAKEIHEKGVGFSGKAVAELDVFSRAVRDIIEKTCDVFTAEDLILAGTVEPLEEVIDNMNDELKLRHVKRLRKGECTIEMGFIFSDITTNFERVADHCSNIAVCLIEINQNEFETHEYLDKLKQKDNSEFYKKYEKYKERYILP